MRRTKFKLAAGLAVLATAGGGALQLADGSQADRPTPDPEPRTASEGRTAPLLDGGLFIGKKGRPMTPDEKRAMEFDDGRRKSLLDTPGFAGGSMKSASFDPIVQDALDGVDDIGKLVDETIAGLPSQPAPSTGGVTVGDVSGGGITDAVLGLINPGMEKITGAMNSVLAGKELTPEQIEYCEFLMAKGVSYDAMSDILAVQGQIDIDLANDHLKQLYPDGFTDGAGVTWKPDHHAGGWIKVTEDPITGTPVYTPTPSIPPYSPGHSSSSPWNDEPKPSLLELGD
jgi:hypothetical protein